MDGRGSRVTLASMTRPLRLLLAAIAMLASACAAPARAEAQARASWDGVARVVVIGDLHGDYEKFADMLAAAALIDAEGDWVGGQAHLVQLGDIPDRGPSTRAIMDHLMRLERQARRAGGHVHALIGNHEAMNVEGDLRYTVAEEYAAFADRNSARRRDAFYERTLDYLRQNPPEAGLPVFDEAFRGQWYSEHPLGFVEHREAWSARGNYGGWVAAHDSVIRINQTLYLHGGLGPAFPSADANAMNQAVRAALRGAPRPDFADILTNEQGPLWYRGLASNEEAVELPHVEALLARHGVAHIVIGHTKRAPLVLPRFGGRVILTDIAVPSGHTDPHAFLMEENGELLAVHRGQRVALRASSQPEVCAYLAAIAALDPPNSPVAGLSASCASPSESTTRKRSLWPSVEKASSAVSSICA